MQEISNFENKLNELKKEINGIEDNWAKTEIILRSIDNSRYDELEYDKKIEILKIITPEFYNEDDSSKDLNIYELGLLIKRLARPDLDNYKETDIGLFFEKYHIKYLDFFEKVKYYKNIRSKIYSNDLGEIRKIAYKFEDQIIDLSNYEKERRIKELEQIFMSADIPHVFKVYKYFEILYPDLSNINYKSPNLKMVSDPIKKHAILFSDMLKCSMGSNNKSLNNFIFNIKKGNEILKKYFETKEKDASESDILDKYISYLNLLYNNSLYGKTNPRELKNNLEQDSQDLLKLFLKDDEKSIDKLPDRIVRMFFSLAGINTVSELEESITNKILFSEKRNIDAGNNQYMQLKKGDFIKSLTWGYTNYDIIIDNILQNGNVSKEFLGIDSDSDNTPLDIDFDKINFDPLSFREIFQQYDGPIWYVLKDDERLNYSRSTNRYFKDKIEIFNANEKDLNALRFLHYCIRTGISSSDINYFVIDESSIKLNFLANKIVKNGFYIPVANREGEIIFTPSMYYDMKNNIDKLEESPEIDNIQKNKIK